MRIVIAFCAISLLFPLASWAEEESPDEYEEGEFDPWLLKLRRGEVILFGSLPFSLFFVSFGYDLYRYAAHLAQDDRNRYAPWPFRGANSIPYDRAENVGVAVGASVASLLFAVGDFVIGELRARNQLP